MAKPFYSIEEVSALLKKTPDEIKGLVRDGKLREFRDAGKVFFKADDVDKLAGKGKSDTGELTLDSADDELPTIASSGNTSVIGLEAVNDKAAKKAKEDTATPAGGIGVFEDDELEIDADPMAKTTITSAARDQVSLEGTGSGSGLLDLTREADDTSLGAELLDEIYPGQEAEEAAAPARPAAREAAPPAAAEEEAADQGETVAPPTYIQVGDPMEGFFDGWLVAALVMMAFTGFAVAAALQGFVPDFVAAFAGNMLLLLLVPIGVMAVAVLAGWLIGKSTSTRRAT